MWDALINHQFLQNALWAGLLASLACGIIGSYVVTNRIVFLSGGISHTAFGGIGLAYYFNINPLIGAMGFSLLASILMSLVIQKSRLRSDSIIGAIWAIGMAVGIIAIQWTPGYSQDLMSYLFGDILTVPVQDIWLIFILDMVIVTLIVLLFRQFQAISFDKEFAQIMGLPVNFLFLLLYCLIALTVVVLIRVVGVILVIALLSLPATISNLWTKNLKSIMILSVLLGTGFTITGLWISYQWDIPSGPAIVLFSGAVFFLSLLMHKFMMISDQSRLPK